MPFRAVSGRFPRGVLRSCVLRGLPTACGRVGDPGWGLRTVAVFVAGAGLRVSRGRRLAIAGRGGVHPREVREGNGERSRVTAAGHSASAEALARLRGPRSTSHHHAAPQVSLRTLRFSSLAFHFFSAWAIL